MGQVHRYGSIVGAQKQVQHPQSDTEGKFDGLRLWGPRIKQEVVFESHQIRVGMVADACEDSRTVCAHIGVEDGEAIGDGGRGPGRDTDRTEDVDALPGCELTAEVGHIENGGSDLDGGDGVAKWNITAALPDVLRVEVGQCQHHGGVATEGGDQRREAGQRRAPDQLHVLEGQEVVQKCQDDAGDLRQR